MSQLVRLLASKPRTALIAIVLGLILAAIVGGVYLWSRKREAPKQ